MRVHVQRVLLRSKTNRVSDAGGGAGLHDKISSTTNKGRGHAGGGRSGTVEVGCIITSMNNEKRNDCATIPTTTTKEVSHMAAETLSKRTLLMALDNGIDSEGKQQTVNVPMNFFGGVDKGAWNADKALAIAEAAEACLTKTIYNVQTGTTSIITAS